MTISKETLEVLLKGASLLQIVISLFNMNLVRLLGWRTEVGNMSLLVREVFYVHMWFISITLVLFATLTWVFASDMVSAGGGPARWLAAGIGIFWAIRTVIQFVWYSSEHWKGKSSRTFVHIALLLGYSGMTLVYLGSAFGIK